MANSDDPLFRAVEEELRREQLARLWEKYGIYLAIAAVAIVLGVGGFKWNEARRIAAAEHAGEQYEAALRLSDQGKEAEAAKSFETIAEEGADGYATLARLQLAGAAAKSGKTAEALAIHEALAKDAPDKLLRDFAKLQAAALRIGQADFTEMQNRLNDLAADGGPWRSSARELLAVAALRANQPDIARTALEQLLADGTTPASIAARARNMMASLVASDRAKTASSSSPEAAKN